jgi:hypothetical protein
MWGIFFLMKPTRQSTNKYIRVQFEDVGELSKHLKEVASETQSGKSVYLDREWDELCERHGICGDSKQDWQ